jgi:hypothetical protein
MTRQQPSRAWASRRDSSRTGYPGTAEGPARTHVHAQVDCIGGWALDMSSTLWRI